MAVLSSLFFLLLLSSPPSPFSPPSLPLTPTEASVVSTEVSAVAGQFVSPRWLHTGNTIPQGQHNRGTGDILLVYGGEGGMTTILGDVWVVSMMEEEEEEEEGMMAADGGGGGSSDPYYTSGEGAVQDLRPRVHILVSRLNTTPEEGASIHHPGAR